MNNNNTKTAAQRGQEKHREASYGPGVEKEKTIAPGNRVDAIDRSNHTIYELKPNNLRAIIRGQGQLVRYLTAASGKYGGTWFGILITYD